ncbi:MAG: CHAP domain-containing protein [bacterium]|nr:CHAP domain-containing protein [bacterium]
MGNAKEVHKNKLFKGWKILQGTSDLMQGDIIISTKGRYGHIAIVDRVTSGQVFVLEQNGSGKNSGNGL